MMILLSILFSQFFACSTPKEITEPSISPPEARLRRLTLSQYQNSLLDIFGSSLVLPTNLEPDAEVEGLISIGAGVNSISPTGVERYETAAFSIAEQIINDDNMREILFSCDIEIDPETCGLTFINTVGSQLWRRPLTEEESGRLQSLVLSIGSDSNDIWTGVEFGLAAMLQSPHFLYRTEHGPDQLTAAELASRLSFLIWNGPPDAELLASVFDASILEKNVLEDQLDRLLSDERAKRGIRNLFTETLSLHSLDSLVKDPLIFTHASPDLGPSAREETLLMLEALILEKDVDFRSFLTTRETFVNRRLAALYNIAAPSEDGFGSVLLPDDGIRRGFLGQASFLALQSHSTGTSATLRGMYVRQKLLCQEIPPPPADVDTSIPEADAESPTLRERIQSHLTEPSCSSCHNFMDLLGLGFEQFDGIGRYRTTENDAIIDPTGSLDDADFANAWDMSEKIAAHSRFATCMTEQLYKYTTGHSVENGEDEYVEWLSETFVDTDHSYLALIRTLVLSDAFQQVGGLQ